jgi:CHAT domain-containing protein
LKVYDDVIFIFRKKGKDNESLRIGDAALNDDKLMPGERALGATRLARSWILSGDNIRAERYQNVARALAAKTTAEESKALSQSIPLEIAANDLILLSNKGETKRASVQAEVVASIYWQIYLDAASPKSKTKTLEDWARFGWDHARYEISANRVPNALAHSRDINRRIESETIAPYSRATAKAALALSLSASGLYANAFQAADQAVKICETAKVSTTSNNCNLARQVRARVVVALNRAPEALPDLAYLTEARAQSQMTAGNFSQTSLDMLAFVGKGDWASARGNTKQDVQRATRRFGADHARTKDFVSALTLINLRDPAYVFSKSEAERFLSPYLSTSSNYGDSSQRGIEFDMVAIEETLQRIIDGNGMLGADDASELAFTVAEYLRSGASQAALYDGASKMAAANPELRALIEKEQTLKAAQSDRRGALAKELNQAEKSAENKPDETTVKRQQEAIKNAENMLAAEDSRLKETRAEIAKRFPVYQELSNPRIPLVKELAAQLLPGEAYVSMYSGRRVGAVFVVTPNGRLALHRVAKTADATLAMVKAIRSPFDAAQVPSAVGKWAGFDVSTALGLYQTWLGVAAKDLEQVQTVHLALGGALASVPWAATLMQKPTSLENAHWLGLEKALAITPGASSVVLNRTLKIKTAEKPFIAFADPQFSKSAAATIPSAVPKRNLLVRVSDGAGTSPTFDYSQFPALPETLDEAQAAAKAAGADSVKDVIAGNAATRTRVLTEKLDDRRIIEFATHGILPGDIPRMNKPALAMAYEGRGLEDSLLTTDDIITLHLNADWILLSACNTGIVESGAGDTISGMSRAFFAAGAKSVLATQWSVESESAKQLVVNTMASYSSDPSVGKAQSLALAQRSMASGKHGDLYRHPYFWAAYFVMGEPGRGMSR